MCKHPARSGRTSITATARAGERDAPAQREHARAERQPAPPTLPKAEKPAGPYNVILLLVDSLRADMPWALPAGDRAEH